MLQWKTIHSIQDEEVLRFLGKKRVAMIGNGLYAQTNQFDIYLLVVGNGQIIKTNTAKYVCVVLSNQKYMEDILGDSPHLDKIMFYAIEQVEGIIQERYLIENLKKKVEKDFGSS